VEKEMKEALRCPKITNKRFKKALRAVVDRLVDLFRKEVRENVRRMVWRELTERGWFNMSIYYLMESDLKVEVDCFGPMRFDIKADVKHQMRGNRDQDMMECHQLLHELRTDLDEIWRNLKVIERLYD
jgi:hypothetical protein